MFYFIYFCFFINKFIYLYIYFFFLRTTAVATSHFESNEHNHEARCEQIELAYKELEKYQESFLCGDFNYDGKNFYFIIFIFFNLI